MNDHRGYRIVTPRYEARTEKQHRDFWTEYWNNYGCKGDYLYPGRDTTFCREKSVRQESSLYAFEACRLYGDAQLNRKAHHARHDPIDAHLLYVITGGLMIAEPGEEEVEIGPGMAALGTLDSAFSLRWQEVQGFTFLLPRLDITPKPNAGVWRTFEVRKGLGRLTGTLMRSLHEERNDLTEPEFNVICDRLSELLCMLAVGDDQPATGHLTDIEPMARRYVQQNVGNRQLSLASVAADLGWSSRQLQAALQQAGTTYRDLVRDERLAAARRLLGNPAFQHLPILEIALNCGFSSGNVLSMLFRERYGESPRDYRYRALGKLRP